jgi:hypothetical protein
MITTTLGALVRAADDQPERVSAWTRLTERSWPVRLAYRMAKLTKLIRAEVSAYNDIRIAIIKELGVESNGNWAVTPEQWPTFTERMSELLLQSVTIEWEPIQLAELGAVDISAADLDALDVLVVGEPANPPAAASASLPPTGVSAAMAASGARG